MQRSQLQPDWLAVDAIVQRISGSKDLNPELTFRYLVNTDSYEDTLEIPVGHDLTKAEPGNHITVYYDPDHPSQVRLQAKGPKDGWLIFASGTGAMLLGIVMLLQ